MFRHGESKQSLKITKFINEEKISNLSTFPFDSEHKNDLKLSAQVKGWKLSKGITVKIMESLVPNHKSFYFQ